MTVVVANAFTLSMLPGSAELDIRKHGTGWDGMAQLAVLADGCGGAIRSFVGHADTAALFSRLLKQPIEMNRESYTLTHDDVLFVGQYTGPRLPEGATTLPDGATVTWWTVRYAEPRRSWQEMRDTEAADNAAWQKHLQTRDLPQSGSDTRFIDDEGFLH